MRPFARSVCEARKTEKGTEGGGLTTGGLVVVDVDPLELEVRVAMVGTGGVDAVLVGDDLARGTSVQMGLFIFGWGSGGELSPDSLSVGDGRGLRCVAARLSDTVGENVRGGNRLAAGSRAWRPAAGNPRPADELRDWVFGDAPKKAAGGAGAAPSLEVANVSVPLLVPVRCEPQVNAVTLLLYTFIIHRWALGNLFLLFAGSPPTPPCQPLAQV